MKRVIIRESRSTMIDDLTTFQGYKASTTLARAMAARPKAARLAYS